jgi:hypothetical protein
LVGDICAEQSLVWPVAQFVVMVVELKLLFSTTFTAPAWAAPLAATAQTAGRMVLKSETILVMALKPYTDALDVDLSSTITASQGGSRGQNVL